MVLKIVGAGLGRTGTHSLQLALQQLLGGPCYHMLEVIADPDVKVQQWMDAMDGNADWDAIMKGYVASVDWPAAAFWRELADANPGAIVLLSTRSGADAWWKSAHDTIFEISQREAPPDAVITAQMTMAKTMLARRFTPGWTDEAAAMRAYEEHNAAVRASVPASRLVDWQPGDGWEPICAALGVAVPDTPFPHVNTTDEFRAMLGLNE